MRKGRGRREMRKGREEGGERGGAEGRERGVGGEKDVREG